MTPKITKALNMLMLCLATSLLSILSTGCLHEFPLPPCTRPVTITIEHEDDWTYYEYQATRGADTDNGVARYHLKVTQAGRTDVVVYEYEHFVNDMETKSVSFTLPLPEGEHDIWVWRDIAECHGGSSLHFDTSDFGAITYSQPYRGNTPLRDAFRGMTSIYIPTTTADDCPLSARVELERPLASYSFIATDLEEFVERETRNAQFSPGAEQIPAYAPIMAQYKVVMRYTGYMPSKYNNYIDRPTGSDTGVSYDSEPRAVNSTEALMAYDHVLVNGHESSVAVQLELYDKRTGDLVGRSSVINVPTQRGRHTIVRGKFLTSRNTSGVGINPDFDGDYNIEIK